jgi:hypothetical protein
MLNESATFDRLLLSGKAGSKKGLSSSSCSLSAMIPVSVRNALTRGADVLFAVRLY